MAGPRLIMMMVVVLLLASTSGVSSQTDSPLSSPRTVTVPDTQVPSAGTALGAASTALANVPPVPATTVSATTDSMANVPLGMVASTGVASPTVAETTVAVTTLADTTRAATANVPQPTTVAQTTVSPTTVAVANVPESLVTSSIAASTAAALTTAARTTDALTTAAASTATVPAVKTSPGTAGHTAATQLAANASTAVTAVAGTTAPATGTAVTSSTAAGPPVVPVVTSGSPGGASRSTAPTEGTPHYSGSQQAGTPTWLVATIVLVLLVAAVTCFACYAKRRKSGSVNLTGTELPRLAREKPNNAWAGPVPRPSTFIQVDNELAPDLLLLSAGTEDVNHQDGDEKEHGAATDPPSEASPGFAEKGRGAGSKRSSFQSFVTFARKTRKRDPGEDSGVSLIAGKEDAGGEAAEAEVPKEGDAKAGDAADNGNKNGVAGLRADTASTDTLNSVLTAETYSVTTEL